MMEVRIDGWQKAIRFSSAHLTADLGKCERLHGHSYAIHCVVAGETGGDRIVMDFVEISRALKAIADELDHYILVPTTGDVYDVKSDQEKVTMTFKGKDYTFPRDDCYLLPTPSSTAEDLVQFVLGELVKRVTLPPGVKHVRVGVDEGYGQGAWAEHVVGGT